MSNPWPEQGPSAEKTTENKAEKLFER